MTSNRAYAPMFSHPDSEDLFGIKSRDERNDGWMSGLMSDVNKKKEERRTWERSKKEGTERGRSEINNWL